MEFESSVSGSIVIEKERPEKKRTLDELFFIFMGDATFSNILVMVFAVLFFGSTPIAMLLFFGTYSGGMRWLITIGLILVMGFVALYIMRMGLKKQGVEKEKTAPQMEFRGALSDLTSAMERASSGYVYSQEIIRERLCEDIMNRAGLLRNLDFEKMNSMLESGDASFVGDAVLEKFLLTHRRCAEKGNEIISTAKGKSAERGRRFMAEIDDIIKRVEALN